LWLHAEQIERQIEQKEPHWTKHAEHKQPGSMVLHRTMQGTQWMQKIKLENESDKAP
jgi:hypothetical protein